VTIKSIKREDFETKTIRTSLRMGLVWAWTKRKWWK